MPKTHLDVGAIPSGVADASVNLLVLLAFDMLLTLSDELDENHACKLKIGDALECGRPNPG